MKKLFVILILLFVSTVIVNECTAATATWVGGSGGPSTRTDWFTKGNWDINKVPTNSDDVVIAYPSSSGYFAHVTANASCLSLTIDPGVNYGAVLTIDGSFVLTVSGSITNNGSIEMAGSGQINVTGNWTNNAYFTRGTSTVIFNGSSAQTIGGTAITEFNNLTLSNSSGFSLSHDQTVYGAFTLTSGVLTLGSNTLTLGTSASIGGTPSSSKMIITDGSGVVKKMFSGIGSFTFPIGENTGTVEYSPYSVNFASGTFSSGYVTARVIDAKHPNNTSTNNYITRYWSVTSSGITAFSCDIEGYYTDADVFGVEGSMTCGIWNGSSWFDLAISPDAANNKIRGTVTTNFGDFTAGDAVALPVELTSFSASIISNKVNMNWKTTTEVNNYGFSVERKAGNDWNEIGFVAGHGTVNTPQQYSFIDNNPVRLSEVSYRLKQMDRDGATSYSPVVNVKFNVKESMVLDQNYPNPFGTATLSGNPMTNISFTLDQPLDIKMKVYDLTGKLIRTIASGMHPSGNYVIPFNASILPAGTYYYILESAGKNIVKQMQLIK